MGDDVFGALTYIGINAPYSHELDFDDLVETWIQAGRKLPLPDSDSSSVLRRLQSRGSITFMGKSIYDSTSRALAPGRHGRGDGSTNSMSSVLLKQQQQQQQQQPPKHEQKQKRKQEHHHHHHHQQQQQQSKQQKPKPQQPKQKQQQHAAPKKQKQPRKYKLPRGAPAGAKHKQATALITSPPKRQRQNWVNNLHMAADDNPCTGVGIVPYEIEEYYQGRGLRKVMVQGDGHCLARQFGKRFRKQPGTAVIL